MATRYFVDAQGNYIGGFDGAKPPEDSIEVPFPPVHGSQKWNGNSYDPYIEGPGLTKRLEAIFESQPPQVRAKYAVLKAAVKDRLEKNDLEAVELLINSPELVASEFQIPPELFSVRDQLKSEILKEKS